MIGTKKRRGGVALMVGIAALLLSACSPTYPYPPTESTPTVDCSALLSAVVASHRAGNIGGDVGAQLDALGDHCADEYDIATEYFSTATTADRFGPEPCVSWAEYDIHPGAIELLREDGLCTGGTTVAPAASAWPEGSVGWDRAHEVVGSFQRVCGPLTSVRGISSGVFVNIGKDYPAGDRFTFVIWGDWWLDPIEADATVCASGTVYLYEGVTQMELSNPGELEIWG